MRADANSRLKNFYKQKNIKLILNDNLKEETSWHQETTLEQEG